MALPNLENSFLSTGLQGESTERSPTIDQLQVTSPELDFSAVESPTVDSPIMFEYENPFGLNERGDTWFSLRRRQRMDGGMDEQNKILEIYNRLKPVYSDVDIGVDLDYEFPEIDLPEMPGLDFSKLNIELPEYSKDLKLKDLKFGSLNLMDFEFSTPEGVKEFTDSVFQGISDVIDSFDFSLTDDLNPNEAPIDFSQWGSAGTGVWKAVANIQKFRKDPTVGTATRLLDSLDESKELLGNVGVNVGSLPPALAGGLLDAGAIASVAEFTKDPTLGNAVKAYEGADFLLMNYTDIAGMPGSSSDIAGYASKALMVVDAAQSLDAFFDEPDIENALLATASVSAAVAAMAAKGSAAQLTASSISSAVGPAAWLYTGVELLKYLTHDEDYSRSDGRVAYSNGEFTISGLRGADGGPLAYTHWADAQTSAATEAMQTLTDKYGFEVDEDALNNVLSKKGYFTNNAQYAKMGGRDASSGAVDFLLSVLKGGAIKPGENTPFSVVENEEKFGKVLGKIARDAVNNAAEHMMDNDGFVSREKTVRGRANPYDYTHWNYTVLPFADQQSAKNYAAKRTRNEEVGTIGVNYFSTPANERPFYLQVPSRTEFSANEDNTVSRKRIDYKPIQDFMTDSRIDKPTYLKEYIFDLQFDRTGGKARDYRYDKPRKGSYSTLGMFGSDELLSSSKSGKTYKVEIAVSSDGAAGYRLIETEAYRGFGSPFA